MEYLIKYDDVKVTFFTVGKFHYPYAVDVEDYQYAMRKAHDFGYQIASLTYTHKVPEDKQEFKESLIKNDEFIKTYTGDRPRYFRAPNGQCDEKCQSYLDDWGYKHIKWDSDTNDHDLETSRSVERRTKDSIDFLKNIFNEERNNYLIRLHDTQNYTVHEIVPWIIKKSGMREKGYRFVSVAECLGDKKSMYASGKIYDEDIILHHATFITGNTTNIEAIDKSIEHNLESDAIINLKPLSLLKYLCIGFIIFIYNKLI